MIHSEKERNRLTFNAFTPLYTKNGRKLVVSSTSDIKEESHNQPKYTHERFNYSTICLYSGHFMVGTGEIKWKSNAKTLYSALIKVLLLVVCLVATLSANAQDDLLASLEEEQAAQKVLVDATFKGTRVINGHSVETRKKGVMDFIISHRFGTIDGGFYELFGLDNASIRIGLEYALSDRLYIGFGRSSFEKTYDGFLKFRLLQQSTGKGSMPFSATWFSSTAVTTLKNPERTFSFTERQAYTHQLLIARKFNSGFSLQVMPTYVHKNTITEEDSNNDALALGMGGRVKLSQWVALCVEYYHQFQQINENSKNAIAIGFDIETGGHVFQLQFTNATAMVPKGFIAETTNDFFDGAIHFGFNISRTFQLK